MPPTQNQYLQNVVTLLRRYRLQTPALLVLDSGKPFAFLGGQLLWVTQPLFSLFGKSTQIAQLAHLLEEPAQVELLIQKLAAEEG